MGDLLKQDPREMVFLLLGGAPIDRHDEIELGPKAENASRDLLVVTQNESVANKRVNRLDPTRLFGVHDRVMCCHPTELQLDHDPGNDARVSIR